MKPNYENNAAMHHVTVTVWPAIQGFLQSLQAPQHLQAELAKCILECLEYYLFATEGNNEE